MGKGQREKERENLKPSVEPDPGLDTTTLSSWPQQKSGVASLTERAIQVPPTSKTLLRAIVRYEIMHICLGAKVKMSLIKDLQFLKASLP